MNVVSAYNSTDNAISCVACPAPLSSHKRKPRDLWEWPFIRIHQVDRYDSYDLFSGESYCFTIDYESRVSKFTGRITKMVKQNGACETREDRCLPGTDRFPKFTAPYKWHGTTTFLTEDFIGRTRSVYTFGEVECRNFEEWLPALIAQDAANNANTGQK